ncbi:MAG: hypothetical protein AAB434_00435 [Planctomycetota bacterium]
MSKTVVLDPDPDSPCKFGLGNARCSKECMPCHPHVGACAEKKCFVHLEMPLEATITSEHAESAMTTIGAELGAKVGSKAKAFGWGLEIEVSLAGTFSKQWEQAKSRVAGITQTIPPACLEPDCKVSVLPVEGRIGGEGSVETQVVRVEYYYVTNGPYHGKKCSGPMIRTGHGTRYEEAAVGPIRFDVAMDIYPLSQQRRDEGDCVCRKKEPTPPTTSEPPGPPAPGTTPPKTPSVEQPPPSWDEPEPPGFDEAHPVPFGEDDELPWLPPVDGWIDRFRPRWTEEAPRDRRPVRDEHGATIDEETCPEGSKPPREGKPRPAARPPGGGK